MFTLLKVQYAWGNKAYTIQFYNRLKDLIKNKISREKYPTSFLTMAKKALRIDQ